MASLSLNTGLKALLSAQYVLETVGHNIANANTPGYSRQSVSLEASLSVPLRGALVGSGVNVTRIERSVDNLLAGRIHSQQGALGGLMSRYTGLSELETFLGANDQASLTGLMDGFFTSVSDLSTAPSDSILRTGLVQSASLLTSRLHEVSNQLTLTGREVGSELRSHASQVNGLADEIVALNIEIANTSSTGTPANDLLDRRDQLITELSQIVDVTTLEGANGSIGVLVSGNTLVGQRAANHMSVDLDNNGNYRMRMRGSQGFVDVSGGTIGGLLQFASDDVPSMGSRFDQLAKELVLSVNRLHSVGMPPNGPLTILTGANPVSDFDGDGKASDELLSNAGLPFDVHSGALYVNVENLDSGAVVKHRIEISETHTTVEGFLDELNSIPNISADIDASGRFRIVANSGFGFDFSARVEPMPDLDGVFGGGQASLAAGATGPYALADGDTLTLTADPGGTAVPVTITFNQYDFTEISQATPEEVAAVINADPDARTNGLVATVVAGGLVVQTAGSGTEADFEVTGGNTLATFGWTGLQGTTVEGHSTSVEPRITGSYTGTGEDTFTFRPTMDGTIGTTIGLGVDVFNAEGDLVSSISLGPDYVPGSEVAVADGISVSFGVGDLSATHGDTFELELASDSDTSDVLVALGLNGLFTGSTASDIEIRRELQDDPSLIASSLTGAPGDSSILVELLSVKEASQEGLEGASLGQFYGDIVSELGFQTSSSLEALNANDAVIQSLEQRRDSISGVNVDEELVDLVAFEQAFEAASRFISVINEINDELLSLI